jgi:protein-S-isoprenylcysteine O-methyltransferase Ste14
MTEEALLRASLALILVTAMSISGYHRAQARKAAGTIPRRSESLGLIVARLAFVLPLVLSFAAYLVRPSWMAWSQLALPAVARWTGVALGGACIPLVYWVVSSLGSNISETVLTKRDHELVVHGPYRRVRHPLYTTGLLLLASASLIMTSWFVGALTILAAAGIRLVVIPAEESALVARFGDRYEDYMKRTGRLVPALKAPES